MKKILWPSRKKVLEISSLAMLAMAILVLPFLMMALVIIPFLNADFRERSTETVTPLNEDGNGPLVTLAINRIFPDSNGVEATLVVEIENFSSLPSQLRGRKACMMATVMDRSEFNARLASVPIECVEDTVFPQ